MITYITLWFDYQIFVVHREIFEIYILIGNGKNIIKIVTILQWAHQIHMKVRKTPLGDGDGLGGQACVAVDLAPLAGQTPACPGGDVALKAAPHKPGWNNTTGGEPPWVSNVVEMIKNGFSEFEGNTAAESAGGNVSSQVLSTCQAESQFEGSAA